MSTDITKGTADVVLIAQNSIGRSIVMTATQGLFIRKLAADSFVRVRVLDISGSTISHAGADLALTASLSYTYDPVRLTATKAVALYSYEATNTLLARTLDITGGVASSVTAGTETAVSSGTSSSGSGARLTDSSMVVAYTNGTTVRVRVLSGITGTTITANTIYDAATSALSAKVFPISATQVLLVYFLTATITAEILDISGAVITVSNTPVTIDTDGDTGSSRVASAFISATEQYLLYRRLSTLALATARLAISGSSITVTSTKDLPTLDAYPDSYTITPMGSGANLGNVMLAYSDYNDLFKVKAVIVSGNNTVLGNILTVHSAAGGAYADVDAISDFQALLTYHADGNDYNAIYLATDPPTGAAVPTNLPMLTASLYGNYLLQAELPMLTARMVGGPKPSVINVTLPALEALMRSGARLNPSLPMVIGTMTGTTNLFFHLDVTLPMITAQMTGTTGRPGSLEVTLPGIAGALRGGGTVRAELPMFTARITSTMGLVGSITATLPMLTADMSATAQAYAIIEALLPMLVASQSGRIVSVLPVMQATITGHTVVAVTYEAYAVNLQPSAGYRESAVYEVTRFDGWQFDQIIRWRNQYYGVKASGLYLLGSDLDGAAPIAWTMHTGSSNLGSRQMKAVREVFVHGRVGAGLTAQASIGEAADQSYAAIVQAGGKAQATRAKFGKGLKAVYWSFGLADPGGGPADIDSLQLDAAELTRKVF